MKILIPTRKVRRNVQVRLTQETDAILDRLKKRCGLPKTQIVELAIRQVRVRGK